MTEKIDTALPEKRGPGRPANILKIAPPRPMPERIRVINEYHQCLMATFAQGAMYAILIGFELHAARATVQHGEWEGWVAANCEFHPATAWRYMQAAERKAKDIPNLARVQDFALGVAPHALAQKQREELFDCVRQATDGETIRQLYLELGLSKQPPQLGGHHPRQGEAPTDAELTAARKQMALDVWKDLEKRLSQWFAKHQYELLSDLDLQNVREVLKGAMKLLPKV